MRLRISLLALTVFGTSVSAFGQSSSSLSTSLQAAAAQAATQPASESVRRLSIDDAVKLALEQNLGIRIQRIDPQIQDVGIAQARAFWAPSLSTNFSKQLADAAADQLARGRRHQHPEQQHQQRGRRQSDAAVGRRVLGHLEQLAVHDHEPVPAASVRSSVRT